MPQNTQKALPVGSSNVLESMYIDKAMDSGIKTEIKLGFFKKKWDSLHARLNSHYKTYTYKKKKHKKIKAYMKSV